MSQHAKSTPFTRLPGFPQVVLKFVKEAKDELKKVTWPTREATIRYTLIVVAASVIVSLIIGGIDFVLEIALESIV
ncbi:MAG: preprotein translocase subunit SecE [Candidatus Andersenbacteria bacterium RIFCSPHIGHO2_12_FULL_46_9]|nr:MAG: Protein translocase subunit [Parcubacteria group bacterium GW2011_GWA2_45_14]OGY34247.1 MAG: preprotein translocase subunit SecE [Candidatus Andersenbacteria bacterium RIFCSPHIGHO2_02_FULL_46_16]OGY38500.1 MAG: preprotein translocase subunit SecE [Candidatus Andersenbacteria bacterium RIFCSPHIGHO2_12_FULL_46_9]OGY42190.1 MAG: preprotein translocase subunit SecE [Candidatus Andersenbacteria bacterium RIFCSPLOWO2_12_FULL_45_8]HBE90063.1 preprotein translocase subunit SecE [Candidatus Ande